MVAMLYSKGGCTALLPTTFKLDASSKLQAGNVALHDIATALTQPSSSPCAGRCTSAQAGGLSLCALRRCPGCADRSRCAGWLHLLRRRPCVSVQQSLCVCSLPQRHSMAACLHCLGWPWLRLAGHRPQQLWGVGLGALDTPARRLAAYDALLATRPQPFTVLDWWVQPRSARQQMGLPWTAAQAPAGFHVTTPHRCALLRQACSLCPAG